MLQDKKLSEYNDDGEMVVMRQNTLFQHMMADAHLHQDQYTNRHHEYRGNFAQNSRNFADSLSSERARHEPVGYVVP